MVNVLSAATIGKKKKEKDPNKWEFLRNQCMLSQSDWGKSKLYQLY
jgi:hypothetical protein